METGHSIEKRKHRRFRVKERVFVEVSVVPIKIGEVVDISLGGLSFQYRNGDIDKTCRIIMEYLPDGFNSKKMTVQTVWDDTIPNLTGNIKIRRRGVRFEKCNESQKSQIGHLIEHYTVDTL